MGPATHEAALAHDTLVATDGARLILRRWLPTHAPPRAIVIALHGMNDYSRAFEKPATFLAEHGIATYAYDQRGFGASARPGIWADTPTLVADLYAAVEAIGSRYPATPLYVLGESMGGAVVVAALAARPPAGKPALSDRLDGAVLSAPALWGRQMMNPFYRLTLWAGYRVVPGLALRPPTHLDIQPSDNVDMLRGLAGDPLVLKRTRIDAVKGLVDLMTQAHDDLDDLPRELPVLALYGMHEQILPRRSTTDSIAHLRSREADTATRVAVYETGYHMLLRDLCAALVWRDVLVWLDDTAAPLPSGAEHVAWQAEEPTAAPCSDPSPAAP